MRKDLNIENLEAKIVTLENTVCLMVENDELRRKALMKRLLKIEQDLERVMQYPAIYTNNQ